MAEEKFISKYTANEIEAMLDKVKTDMRVIQYTQQEINTLLGRIENLVIPSKVSDLQNDSQFITNTVNNLVNYYTKTDTYTKTEVNTLITNVASGGFTRVESLPTTEISTTTIYLVPSTLTKTKNVYDEYINLDGTSNGWEMIGDTKINLSNYVSTTALSTELANYVTSSALATTLDAYYTKSEITTLLTNYYTKSEMNASIASINATIAEINAAIEELQPSGGEDPVDPIPDPTPSEPEEPGGNDEPDPTEPSGDEPSKNEGE